jgi:integrase
MLRRLELPHIRFHDLLHSFVVSSVQGVDSVKMVQENLGHATAAFILDVYGHVSDQMHREARAEWYHAYTVWIKLKG